MIFEVQDAESAESLRQRQPGLLAVRPSHLRAGSRLAVEVSMGHPDQDPVLEPQPVQDSLVLGTIRSSRWTRSTSAKTTHPPRMFNAVLASQTALRARAQKSIKMTLQLNEQTCGYRVELGCAPWPSAVGGEESSALCSMSIGIPLEIRSEH